MATVSINDIKIRILQLKSLGYDKLLHHQSLLEQISKIERDLSAISDEVTTLMETLRVADEQIAAQQNQQQDPLIQPDISQSAQSENQPETFVKVDATKLGQMLSPNNSNTPKSKKTEHNIGRRV